MTPCSMWNGGSSRMTPRTGQWRLICFLWCLEPPMFLKPEVRPCASSALLIASIASSAQRLPRDFTSLRSPPPGSRSTTPSPAGAGPPMPRLSLSRAAGERVVELDELPVRRRDWVLLRVEWGDASLSTPNSSCETSPSTVSAVLPGRLQAQPAHGASPARSIRICRMGRSSLASLSHRRTLAGRSARP
jgi:hypothetical protein